MPAKQYTLSQLIAHFGVNQSTFARAVGINRSVLTRALARYDTNAARADALEKIVRATGATAHTVVDKEEQRTYFTRPGRKLKNNS